MEAQEKQEVPCDGCDVRMGNNLVLNKFSKGANPPEADF